MSLGGFPHRDDAPTSVVHAPLHDAMHSAAAQRIAEGARLALGAFFVTVARLEPDGTTIRVAAWSAEPGARYERALAAARQIVPGVDPMHATLRSNVNPFVRAVHVDGRTMVGSFADASRGAMHPWVLRFAIVILDLRWTISVPLHSNGTVVGSFAATFSKQPTDAQRVAAADYAAIVESSLGGVRG